MCLMADYRAQSVHDGFRFLFTPHKTALIYPCMKRQRVVYALSLVAAALACNSDLGVGGRSSTVWILQLQAPAPADRARAASALARTLALKPGSTAVVNALIRTLSDSSGEVRMAAASALATSGVDIVPASRALHAMLHDSTHSRVRESMTVLVGLLGPGRAGPLIHALAEGLGDPDEVVRSNAIDAFVSIGIRTALPAILKLTNDPSPLVRLSVVRALGPLRAPRPTINAVASAALGDSSSSVRTAAAYSLGGMGAAAVPSLGPLKKSLGDPDAGTRSAAISAISQMGASARGAIPLLTHLQNDPDKNVARAARAAVNRISGT